MKVACLLKKTKTVRERRMEGFAEMERLQKVAERKRRAKRAELEEIKRAVQESEMLKAEIRAVEGRKNEDKARREQEAATQAATTLEAAKPGRIIGKKRKSDATEDSDATDDSDETRLDLAGRPYIPRHKRLKREVDVDYGQDTNDDYEQHHIAYTYARQQAVGKSLFSRTLSKLGTRRASEAPLQRGVDKTKTDYFRLKARGINPETPIVPLTAKQVKEERAKVEIEEAGRSAEPKPWQKSTLRLSRTEERIRRTGARGLATAPIGGTPGYVKPASRGASSGAGTSVEDAIELDSD
jgi:hypothetical protein